MDDQPYNPRLLLVCCLACFATFLATYMRMPVFPLFASSLGADSMQVGFLNALFLFFAGSLCVPAGLLSDRVGRRLPILGGIFILGCSSLLLAGSDSITQLSGICVLSGIGTAVFAPPLMSYVADITPADRLGGAFGWYTMSLYGGMTIGPAIGGFAGKSLGFRPVFLGAGVTILLVFLAVFLFLPRPPRCRLTGGGEGTTWRQLIGVLSNRRLMVCLGTMLGSCVGYGMFITFMPLYLRHLGMNSAHVGMIFAAQALANALSRIPFGRLGDRMGNRSILVSAGLTGFAAVLALLGLSTTLVPLLLGAIAFGTTLGIAFTALVALTADAAPRELRGLAMGLYNSSLYLGMMLSSAGMGIVVRVAGYRSAFFACGAICLVVTLLFHIHYRRPTGARECLTVQETGTCP